MTKIAQHLTRSKSTISIELKRNKVKDKYMPCVAQAKYENRIDLQEMVAGCYIRQVKTRQKYSFEYQYRKYIKICIHFPSSS